MISARLTAEEYSELREEGPSELVSGRTVAVEYPSPRHGVVCGTVQFALSTWNRAADFGFVLARCGIVTERNWDTVRGPDCLVVSRDRLPNGLDAGWFEHPPPNLVVEVLDHDERLHDVLQKVGEYLQLGVDEVWVVDPSERWIERHRPDEASRRFTTDDRIEDSPTLPGFGIDVREFFAGM